MGSGKDHEPRLGSAESLSPYCMAEVYATLSMAKTATFIFLLESISYYEIFLYYLSLAYLLTTNLQLSLLLTKNVCQIPTIPYLL